MDVTLLLRASKGNCRRCRIKLSRCEGSNRTRHHGAWDVDTVAGTGQAGFAGDGGPALGAQLNHPRDLEIGPDGNLYVADTDNHTVRVIHLGEGTIASVVGTGEAGLDEDGREATATRLARPFGIDFDREGNLFVSDTLNSRIVRVQR